jgi:hypothetical protein
MFSCDEPNFQPAGDYISGYVYFTDSNLIPSGGYYSVSLYRNRPRPFDTLPVSVDSLEILRSTYGKYSFYRVECKYTGSYFVAVNWIKAPGVLSTPPPVLGTLGCDTAHNCTSHELVAFPNFTGANYEILTWADTSKKLN